MIESSSTGKTILANIFLVPLSVIGMYFLLPMEARDALNDVELILTFETGSNPLIGLSYILCIYGYYFSYLVKTWWAIITSDDDGLVDVYIEFASTLDKISPLDYLRVVKNFTNDSQKILENKLNFGINGIHFYYQYIFDIFQDGLYSNFSPQTIFLRFGILFLITTVLSLVFTNYLGLYGVFVINLVSIFLFWSTSLYLLNDIFIEKKHYLINLGKWFNFNFTTKVFFELYIDNISISFSLLTLSIALCVYIYCFSYFRGEPNVERLMLFINLFVISMIILVTSGNLMVFFLGWELIGITSFFLINFWSTRMGTLKAAFKAYSFNKLSDVFIFLACVGLYVKTNELNIVSVISQINLYTNLYLVLLGNEVNFIELTSFFLLTAAFIKSAQFGAHIWLPDSMEAPVPASALIHSATLVSAGVFILLRFSPLFELSFFAQNIIPIIGAWTAFFGGVSACYQSDTKRILAYSTISHCGFLMLCYSTGSVEYTLLYLYIHGFFKASSFLCIGNVIRFSNNYQDFRKMGGYYKYMTFEFYMLVLSLFNLCGLPFTLGFFIKHFLLLGMPEYVNIFVYICVLGGAFSGLLYCYRLIYYIFFDTKKAKKYIYTQTRFWKNDNNIKLYSVTTVASNIAIFLLNFIAYITCFYYFNLVSFNIENMSEVLNISFVSANISEYYYLSINFAKNISYVNWLIILCIFLLFNVKWRYKKTLSSNIKLFYLSLNLILFTYVVYEILF